MIEFPLGVESSPPGTATDKKVPKYLVVGFVAANFGLWIALITPIASTMALKVAAIAPGDKQADLGLITALGAIVTLLTAPVAGAISDRTTSRFGMRRPWIIVGSSVGLVGLLTIGATQSIVVVAIAWACTGFAMNFAMGALTAWIPDHVPELQRGRVSGYTDLAQQVSVIFGIIIANVALSSGLGTFGTFLVPSVIGFVLMILFALIMKDRVLSPNLRQELHISILWKSFYFSPRKSPDFTWSLASRFFVIFGFSFFSTYQVFFMMDRLHLDAKAVLGLQSITGIVTVVGIGGAATLSGIISDKIRRRKAFIYVAGVLLAGGSFVLAFTHSIPTLFLAVSIISVGVGIYFSVGLAVAVSVLPDRDLQAARYLGVYNMATALPQAFAPALAPLILAIGAGGSSNNYTLLFVVGGVSVLIGAGVTVFLRTVR
jgi:MFS family permease